MLDKYMNKKSFLIYLHFIFVQKVRATVVLFVNIGDEKINDPR